jgi:hypothetical protein
MAQRFAIRFAVYLPHEKLGFISLKSAAGKTYFGVYKAEIRFSRFS